MIRYFQKGRISGIGYILCVPVSCWVSVRFALSAQPVLDSVLGMDESMFQKGAFAFAFWGMLDACLLLFMELLRLRLLKRIGIALKDDLCGAVLRMSYQAYAAKDSDALSILTNDAKTVSSCYFASLLALYRVVWSFLFSIFTAASLSPAITAVVLLAGAVSVLVPRFLGGRIDRLQLNLSDQKETYSKLIQDMLDGFSTIKTMRAERFFAQKHHRSSAKTEELECRVDAGLYFAAWFSGVCSSAAYIATLLLGGALALQGRMTAGLVVSISQLIGGVVAPLEQVPALLARMRSVDSVRKKCGQLLATRSAGPLPHGAGESLLCKSAAFHYPGTRNGVENVSYTFQMGKKYLLAGASGSGKSTLGRLVAGLYRPEAGGIQYPRAAAGKSGVLYVDQKAHVFRDTLRNNIALGDLYPDSEIWAALDQCCLTGFAAKLPHGLDEVLRENYSCSGGEAARLNLARAVLRRPKILVADEITANLDACTAEHIDAMLAALHGVLLITITHNISRDLAARYDAVLYLENGRLAGSSPPHGLQEQNGMPGCLPHNGQKACTV